MATNHVPGPLDYWSVEPGEDLPAIVSDARRALVRLVVAGIVLQTPTGKTVAIVHKDKRFDSVPDSLEGK